MHCIAQWSQTGLWLVSGVTAFLLYGLLIDLHEPHCLVSILNSLKPFLGLFFLDCVRSTCLCSVDIPPSLGE